MQPYEELDAWRRAHESALAIFSETKSWPKDERFGLIAQIRRAAFSVPVNIVEGRAKLGKREFRRFLDIAWGSLAEVEYSLRFARDAGFLAGEAFQRLEQLRTSTAKPLYGLLRSMGQP
jgi:four helix bundle protein